MNVMRFRKTTGCIALGYLCGTATALAGPSTGPSAEASLELEFRRAAAALGQVELRVADVTERIGKEKVTIGALFELFDKTGDPSDVSGPLAESFERLDSILRDLDRLRARTAVIGATFEKIAAVAKDPKLAEAAKAAVSRVATGEAQISAAHSAALTVVEAAKTLAALIGEIK